MSHFPNLQKVSYDISNSERQPAKHVCQIIVGAMHILLLKADPLSYTSRRDTT